MLTADLAAVVADIPQTITIGGVTRRAVVGDVSKAKTDLDAGGFIPDIGIEVHLFRSDWATLPVIGDTATFNSVEYRIIRTATDPAGTSLRVFLEAKAR